MRSSLIIVSVALALHVSQVSAGIAFRTAPINKMTSENTATSPSRIQYQGVTSVIQSGPWSAGSTCDPTWAYFYEKDNPQFVAILLAARLTGATVEIVVDDSLPKLDGFCQIIAISL